MCVGGSTEEAQRVIGSEVASALVKVRKAGWMVCCAVWIVRWCIAASDLVVLVSFPCRCRDVCVVCHVCCVVCCVLCVVCCVLCVVCCVLCVVCCVLCVLCVGAVCCVLCCVLCVVCCVLCVVLLLLYG